ncbi:hypothetical protein ACFPT7_22320 [Acidicapsa dinghuensis]|uniref:Uncharacterized protein n=1 Tax=Acidicapsa dinghuensis TaxID=2218256 RepID=A0ABW1EL86_9BACT|nr:hypothetical protein [Acidicapsa dinghuensis]
MEDKPEEMPTQEGQDVAPTSSPGDEITTETSTRRELIERYGKYALVATPLLLFASKAHAIHSKP